MGKLHLRCVSRRGGGTATGKGSPSRNVCTLSPTAYTSKVPDRVQLPTTSTGHIISSKQERLLQACFAACKEALPCYAVVLLQGLGHDVRGPSSLLLLTHAQGSVLGLSRGLSREPLSTPPLLARRDGCRQRRRGRRRTRRTSRRRRGS